MKIFSLGLLLTIGALFLGCSEQQNTPSDESVAPTSEVEEEAIGPDEQAEVPGRGPAEKAIQAAYADWLAVEVSEGNVCDEEACYENMRQFQEGEEFDMDCFAALPDEPAYLYGDLNGDEKTDAVVVAELIQCDGGKALQFARTKLVFYSQADGSYLRVDEDEPFYDLGIGYPYEIKEGVVLAQGMEFHEEDPTCCPSIEWQVSYVLKDGKMEIQTISEKEREFNEG